MLECLPEMISGWENELVCITFLKGARVCVVGFFFNAGPFYRLDGC